MIRLEEAAAAAVFVMARNPSSLKGKAKVAQEDSHGEKRRDLVLTKLSVASQSDPRFPPSAFPAV